MKTKIEIKTVCYASEVDTRGTATSLQRQTGSGFEVRARGLATEK